MRGEIYLKRVCSLLQVLDSKGIREAAQEQNLLKVINSFALRDLVDGVDQTMINLVAGCEIGVGGA